MTFHLTDLETPVPLAEIHGDFSATFFGDLEVWEFVRCLVSFFGFLFGRE
jgi:hypothetical protein